MSDDWRDAARAWLGEVLRGASEPHITVHRERVWGEIWRVQDGSESYWFKRGHPTLWSEVALRRLLERESREHLLPLVASDAERGWMLTRDAGATLAGQTAHDPAQAYVDVARALAAVQRSVRVDALQCVGLARFDPLYACHMLDTTLEPFTTLPADHPASVGQAERTRALKRMAAVVVEWRALGSDPVSLSVDHNDLHLGNALAGPRLSDWGDAVIGHPFCTLRSLLGAAQARLPVSQVQRIRDAYLAEFGDPVQLAPRLDVAMRLAVAQRLRVWSQMASPALWAEHSDWITPLWREVGTPLERVTAA